MSFPVHLVPKTDSRILDDNEKFYEEQMLGRYHDTSNIGSIFNNGIIDTSLIDYHHFPGLSCNYMPPSVCDDLRINYLNHDLLREWIPENDEVRINQSDYEIIESREVYKFSMDSIINETIEYEIDKEAHHLQVKIIHKPLIGNYSHCEFKLIISHPMTRELKSLSSKKKYQKILIANLRRLLENNCIKC